MGNLLLRIRTLTPGRIVRYLMRECGILPGILAVRCWVARLRVCFFGGALFNRRMKGVRFISYGNDRYRKARKRIRYEAFRFGFQDVSVYRPEDLPESFQRKFADILKVPRGGGYWVWKICIIHESLLRMREGEILVYCDSGCTINAGGRKRFIEYLDIVLQDPSGMLSFGFNHMLKEKCWTIRELYEAIGCAVDESPQLVGGILFLRKNVTVMRMIEEARRIIWKNPLLITDHYNKNQEPHFIDNRHDQSLLSLLRKKYGSPVLTDETYASGDDWTPLAKMPFWATRSAG
jgi:hypothetical protein